MGLGVIELEMKGDGAEDSRVSRTKLGHVLSNARSLDLLMAHLGREFSMECLLSLIEFIQFQNYIYQQIVNQRNRLKNGKTDINNNTNLENDEMRPDIQLDIDDSKIELKSLENNLISKKFDIEFPPNVPLSSIVFDIKDETNDDDYKLVSNILNKKKQNIDDCSWVIDAKIRSYKLYKKYIALGSEYEINISYRTRQELINTMHDLNKFIENESIDEKKLFWLFRKSSHEMIHLINGSFARFKASTHFAKFLQVCSFLREK